MFLSFLTRNRNAISSRPQTRPTRHASWHPQLEVLEERLAPATRVWDGGSPVNSNWSTAANWVGDVAPVPGVDDLVFPGVAARKANTNDFVNAAFLGISFTGSSYVLGGNAVTLRGNLSADPGTSNNFISLNLNLNADRTFQIGAASVLTINGVIGDSGGARSFTKSGTGLLVLRGANTYAGLTQVREGTIHVEHRLALGATTGGTIIAKGAALRLLNSHDLAIFPPEPLTFGPGPAGLTATLISSGFVEWTGPVTFDPGANDIVVPDQGLAFTGAIGGAGGFRLIASGSSLQFFGDTPNTYAGVTQIARGLLVLHKLPGVTAIPGDLSIGTDDINAGAVALAASNQIADSANVTFVGGSGFFGTLFLNGFAETVGSVSGNGGHILLDSSALTTGANNTSTVFGGDITGHGSLTKVGTGTLRLEGASFYTGPTRLVGPGALEINGIQPNSPVIVDGGALRGSGAIGALQVNAGGTVSPGQGAATGQLTVNGDVTFNAGSTYRVRLNGTTPVTRFDHIRVVGGPPRRVTINNASLDATIAFAAAGGTSLRLIDNATNGGSVGGFAGIPDRGLFTVTGVAGAPDQAFRMIYIVNGTVAITRNTAPMVEYILLDPETIAAGESTALVGQLTDPDEENYLGVYISWGDSSEDQIEFPGLEPFKFYHQYTEPGEYDVFAYWFDESGEGNFRVLPLTVLPAGAPGGGGRQPATSDPGASRADGLRGLLQSSAGGLAQARREQQDSHVTDVVFGRGAGLSTARPDDLRRLTVQPVARAGSCGFDGSYGGTGVDCLSGDAGNDCLAEAFVLDRFVPEEFAALHWPAGDRLARSAPDA